MHLRDFPSPLPQVMLALDCYVTHPELDQDRVLNVAKYTSKMFSYVWARMPVADPDLELACGAGGGWGGSFVLLVLL